MENEKKNAERSPEDVRKKLHRCIDKATDNFALFILTFIEKLYES